MMSKVAVKIEKTIQFNQFNRETKTTARCKGSTQELSRDFACLTKEHKSWPIKSF